MSVRACIAICTVALITASSGGAAVQPPSLDRLVGQLVLARMSGTDPSAAFLQRVRAGQIGGVVLFGDNLGAGGPAELVARLQDAAREGRQPPLLIGIDQEGGIVKRLPGPPTLAPARMRTAAIARSEGLATGRMLKELGITVDLAPVLDVGHGAFITSRTFGNTPALVAAHGIAFATGLADAHVAATAKHFPGLGHATANTDDRPTVVRATRAQLAADWEPFRLAAQRRVPLVMLSTAVYPALGSQAPAALSREAIAELRGLGFSGAIVTDALQTPAINASRSTASASLAAVAAGVDLVLAAGPSSSFRDTDGASTAAYRAILAAAKNGKLPRSRLLAAYGRVLALKRAYAG